MVPIHTNESIVPRQQSADAVHPVLLDVSPIMAKPALPSPIIIVPVTTSVGSVSCCGVDGASCEPRTPKRCAAATASGGTACSTLARPAAMSAVGKDSAAGWPALAGSRFSPCTAIPRISNPEAACGSEMRLTRRAMTKRGSVASMGQKMYFTPKCVRSSPTSMAPACLRACAQSTARSSP